MLGIPLLYFKGMRLLMFQLSGFYYRGGSFWSSLNPRDLRTHILRLLGPKTVLYQAFEILGYFDPRGPKPTPRP